MNNMASGIMNTNLGNVQIDKDVIAKYAGSSAVECFGIVGMATVSVKDGFAKPSFTLMVAMPTIPKHSTAEEPAYFAITSLSI